MPVTLVEAHPHIPEDAGRWAVTRGPLVYCLEQVDNPGVDLDAVVLPRGVAFAEEDRPSFLGRVTVLTASVRETWPAGWENHLYRRVDPTAVDQSNARPIQITAIPYFAWANREPGAMRVWLRHD